MSYTEIYSFDKAGNAGQAGEVKNSWRGAMAIWSYLEKKYLPPYIPDYVKHCNWYRAEMTREEIIQRNGFEPSRLSPSLSPDGENPMKEVWGLADNTDVPEHERIALFTTFDKCLVKKEDLPTVIAAFRKFEAETSLPEQADILETLFQNEDCIAVGWNQTSVNGDTWGNAGGYDEENDESIPYNCLTKEEHYWLFDEFQKAQPQES